MIHIHSARTRTRKILRAHVLQLYNAFVTDTNEINF